MGDQEIFEMEISKLAMKIAKGLEVRLAIKEIAKTFNKTTIYVESRLQELVHENLIQTMRELT